MIRILFACNIVNEKEEIYQTQLLHQNVTQVKIFET